MTTTKGRDGWVMAGMAIAAASAATASFTGLRGLALAAGWPGHLSWLLPVTIDAYAMTSVRVWFAPTGHGRRGRRFAQANAIGAIGASIAGNAVYHALSVGLLQVTWPVVVVVGAIPAAVLGLTAHLHALRTLEHDEPVGETGVVPPLHENSARSGATPPGRPVHRPGTHQNNHTEDDAEDRTEAVPAAEPNPAPRPRPRRRAKPRTEDQLIAAARAADAHYRANHNGRPISRDALRTALRIAGPRATELRRLLATPTADPMPQQPTPPAQAPPGLAATSDRKEAYATR
jgi:hypothetical protein